MDENQVPEEGKQDMVDRKAAWLERMFDRLFLAIKENPFATLLVLSVALNFYVISLYLNTVASSKAEMIAEVRSTVKKETARQLAPVQARQDSISNNVDSMGKKVDTSITSVKGIVQSVQKYIDKKQK